MAALAETVIRRICSVFVKDSPRIELATSVSTASTLTNFGALRLLVREGGLRALKIWGYKLICDGGAFHPVKSLLVLKAEILWSHGDHAGVRLIAGRLASKHRSTLGYFYLAQSSFVCGRFEEAAGFLRELLELKPDHSDGIYLLASCLQEKGETQRAWKLLEDFALCNPRRKTWQQLANMVRSPADLCRLMACHAKAQENKMAPKYGREISDYLALAAMNAGDYFMAKKIWRGVIDDALTTPSRFVNRRPRLDIYSKGRAAGALLDLKKTLEHADIEMFLVSGTLLGCIREGRPLEHDKDIDVGIWEDVSMERLIAAVHESGLFFFIPSRSPWIVRVRHLNGIPLDLFYHYRDGNSYWHGATKIKWHNSPFTLRPTTFLNETFLIPADHDTYLRENYGDWITPKTEFDAMFDTPNGEIIHKDELIIHSLRQLFESVSKKSARKTEYYLEKLQTLGEQELVARFRSRSLT